MSYQGNVMTSANTFAGDQPSSQPFHLLTYLLVMFGVTVEEGGQGIQVYDHGPAHCPKPSKCLGLVAKSGTSLWPAPHRSCASS